MFNALKKFVTNEQHVGKSSVPTGMQAMGQNLQRRFAKGVQYNMKIIIKGDRNTGKTTLFHRLQGERFKEEYLPTPEIQVTSIQWNYKATDDVVKVEVWDVVDKGKSKKKADGLKLETSQEAEDTDEPCLDARFLNVYKGANGVVFMVDITKQWTWGYVERELPNVPNHIPVLVLSSFRDMADHRTVAEDTMRYFIDNFERPPDSAKVLLAEASMKNGFGLKYLHTFFNVPFLQLQRETLLRQLETNNLETNATLDELDMRKESIDQNYQLYLESLEERRKQKKSKAATPTMLTPTVPNGDTPQPPSPAGNSESERDTPIKLSPATTPKQTTPNQTTPNSTPTTVRRDQSGVAANPPAKPPGNGQVTPQESPATPIPPTTQPSSTSSSSLSQRFSKWFGGSESRVQQGMKEEDEKQAVVETVAEVKTGPITSVDEFVVGGGLGGFLDDVDGPGNKKGKAKQRKAAKATPTPAPPPEESDSEEDINPMVAGFQEDLDSDDEVSPFRITHQSSPAAAPVTVLTTPTTTSYDVELSSDNEDAGPILTRDIDVSDDDPTPPSFARNHRQSPPAAVKVATPDLTNSVHSSRMMPDRSDSDSLKSPEQIMTSDSEDEPQPVHVSQTSSQSTDPDASTSPASPMLQLQQEDFNFLENVGSSKKKPALTKKPSLPADDFDNLLAVTKDEDISDSDTMTSTSTSSSAVKKKKKHKSKEKDRDEERSGSRKHKHKKHKDKSRDQDKPSGGGGAKDAERGGKEEKKRKKKSKSEGHTTIDDDSKQDYDALEAFLEGPSYEAL